MDHPATRLDERFSAPDAAPTPWEEARTALERAQISWISTVRADGRPHVTPLVAVWHEENLYFTTGPEEQKAKNLGHNPDVVVTTGRDDWDRGIDVMVEGRAQRVTDAPLLERLAAVWRSKWDGSWKFDVAAEGFRNEEGGFAHVYEVRPAKILSFRRGIYAQTRYRFGT